MIEIREVLRRGASHACSSARDGVDRKTVDRYVTAARELGVVVGVEPTDDVVAEVSQRAPGFVHNAARYAHRELGWRDARTRFA